MAAAAVLPKDEKKSFSESLMDKAKEKIDSSDLMDKAKEKIDAAKEKIDAVFHYASEKPEDIDEKTGLKAPNVFGRVKEEIDALVVTISAKSDEITGDVKDKFHAITGDAKGDEKSSEPIKINDGTPLHHKETHGTCSDTPIDAVNAPSVYQRAKEEMEALVGATKESSSNTEDGGFRSFIARLLQKVCHPWDSKKEESKSD